MKINKDLLLAMKKLNLAEYKTLKLEILYHTNKIEGSTFTMEQLTTLVERNFVIGNHSLDDIIETRNSTKLFDFIVDTIDEPISLMYMRECHQILKRNTSHDEIGECGKFKGLPNSIVGAPIDVAQPHEVEEKLIKLIDSYENKKLSLDDIIDYHIEFETIHPFLDGNGRVGRMLMFKQSINNNKDIIIVDEKHGIEYKQSLNNKEDAYLVFRNMIKNTDIRLEKLIKNIDELSNNIKMKKLLKQRIKKKNQS